MIDPATKERIENAKAAVEEAKAALELVPARLNEIAALCERGDSNAAKAEESILQGAMKHLGEAIVAFSQEQIV